MLSKEEEEKKKTKKKKKQELLYNPKRCDAAVYLTLVTKENEFDLGTSFAVRLLDLQKHWPMYCT
jgi:hypothetical protein